MTEWLNQKPLFSCSRCCDDCSWPEEDLRVHNGKTFCENCWEVYRLISEDEQYGEDLLWIDLEPFKSGWVPMPEVER